MSRQEDFSEMSKDLHVQVLSNPWTIYETGCEDGYQYAVEKACEWLAKQDLFYNVGNGGFYRNADLLVEQFKQFMEE